ncbi:tRNA pseudouridine(38-40) synthase TruA [Yeguia hominis]|uniref:tRNA pseudouridine synthase A n=1 Tax=Yeguia hominis TaxID=2763662 RepID=A0A926DA48_9FIRM|nr:tRNA pseudouridine(38-40) synthase TruA [Yeguia hominis]
MRNLLLMIGYDGAAYHGWQVQQNARAVQEVFQEALQNVLGERPDIKGCSRTDTGVHAREYGISFRTAHRIPCHRLVFALNRFLPPDMAVFSCREMPEDFHARYSCKGKEYVYEIWNSEIRSPFLEGRALHYRYPMDAALLQKAATCYLGKHDFTSFCTVDKRERRNMERTVTRAEVVRSGEMVSFTVSADGFLYNMVRIMTGTLLRVAQGKISPEDLPQILAAKDRKAAGPTAPACGLYLNKVFY